VVNQLAEDQWRERVATAAKARGRPLTEVERQALRPTPKEVQAVSRASREQKMPRDRAELDAGWGAQLARHGYTAPLASGAVEARRRPRGSRTSGAWPWRLWASVATRRTWPMACGERASPPGAR